LLIAVLVVSVGFLSGCTDQSGLDLDEAEKLTEEFTKLSIVKFESNPEEIDYGESATLSWVVMGSYTTVTIEPDIGEVDLVGDIEITPERSIEYTLTAINATTKKTKIISVDVKPIYRIEMCSYNGFSDFVEYLNDNFLNDNSAYAIDMMLGGSSGCRPGGVLDLACAFTLDDKTSESITSNLIIETDLYSIFLSYENDVPVYVQTYISYMLNPPNYPPIPNILVDKCVDYSPFTVDFTGYACDPDGSIVSYHWDFGDGSNSTEQNPTHTFQNNGTYSTTLTVKDNNGATSEDTITIIVSSQKTKKENGETNGNKGDNNQGGSPNNPPTALVSASPITGYTPLTVNFTGLGMDIDGTIQSYYWDFGDGNTSNQQNPTHVYYHAGNYAVALIVTDDGGATDIDTISITVEEKLVGLSVTNVMGHVSNGTIDNIIISIRTIAGSNDVNLNSVSLNLNNSTNTVQLHYDNNSYCNNLTGGIFDFPCFNLTNQQFGLIVLQDNDNSVTQNNPIINRGDVVMLTVNTSSCFNGIPSRIHVTGLVIPEDGISGIISFVTPASYVDTVIELQ
jgi:PKD repeat protein